MKTTFYNIIKKERVGEYRIGYYTVDGKRPALPPDIVELEVIQDPQPPQQQNTLLLTQWVADLENMLWRLVWTQTPKTKKTIDECLGEIENNYQARVDAGAVMGDVHLKMADSDRSAFTQLLTLLNEAERFGQLPTETTISDYNSNTITLPTMQLRLLIIQYGLIYQSIWSKRVQLTKLVEAAQSDEDRMNLDLSFDSV